MKNIEWVEDIVHCIAVALEDEEIHVAHDGYVIGLTKPLVRYIYNKALQAACKEIKAIQESEKRDETRLWPLDNMPWDYPERVMSDEENKQL